MKEQPSLKEQLKLLEERLLKPEVRKSQKELEELLADDFMEFGSSGRTYNKRQSIEGLLSSTPENPEYKEPEDFKAKLLAPGLVLVTYHSAKCSKQGGELKYSLRSSIWRQKGDTWEMVFHQGTPMGDESR